MSSTEQKLWFNAFIAAKNAVTDPTNMKSCFDIATFKKGLRAVVDEDVKGLNGQLTAQSKKIRNALSCLKTSADVLKANLNTQKSLETNLKDTVDYQTTVNQCASVFLTKLLNVLNLRKRYLLLNSVDLNNIGRITNAVVDFPWSEDEMKTIVPAFIDYANCYSGLPNSYFQNIQDTYVALSNDDSCKGTVALRFLQETTTTTQPATTDTTTQPATTTDTTTQPATTTTTQPATTTTTDTTTQPATTQPATTTDTTTQPATTQPAASSGGSTTSATTTTTSSDSSTTSTTETTPATTTSSGPSDTTTTTTQPTTTTSSGPTDTTTTTQPTTTSSTSPSDNLMPQMDPATMGAIINSLANNLVTLQLDNVIDLASTDETVKSYLSIPLNKFIDQSLDQINAALASDPMTQKAMDKPFSQLIKESVSMPIDTPLDQIIAGWIAAYKINQSLVDSLKLPLGEILKGLLDLYTKDKDSAVFYKIKLKDFIANLLDQANNLAQDDNVTQTVKQLKSDLNNSDPFISLLLNQPLSTIAKFIVADIKAFIDSIPIMETPLNDLLNGVLGLSGDSPLEQKMELIQLQVKLNTDLNLPLKTIIANYMSNFKSLYNAPGMTPYTSQTIGQLANELKTYSKDQSIETVASKIATRLYTDQSFAVFADIFKPTESSTAASTSTSTSVPMTSDSTDANVTGVYALKDDTSASLSNLTLSIKTKSFLNKLVNNPDLNTDANAKLISLLKMPSNPEIQLKRKVNLINQVMSKMNADSTAHFKSDVAETILGSTCLGTWKYDVSIFYGAVKVACSDELASYCPKEDKLFSDINKYKDLNIFIGCINGVRYGVIYVHKAESDTRFWDVYGVNETVAPKTNQCAKKMTQNGFQGTDQCLPNIKETCSKQLNETCKASGLADSLTTLVPSETGESLPKECKIKDGDSMVPCLAWINHNILKNSLTVDYDNLYNLQVTVSASTKQLRMLIDSTADSINVKKEDPLTSHTEVSLDSSSYVVANDAIVVDSSSSITTAPVSVLTNEITKGSSASYYSISFTLLAVLAILF
jgi:hypothetical protein